MSLASVEKKIDGMCKSIKSIEIAIVGDIEKDKPGLQDKVRDLKIANVVNRKQHVYLFFMAAGAISGVLWLSANGKISSLIEFIIGVL